MKGTFKVEQINRSGKVVIDYDETYSSKELKLIIKKYFNIIKEENKLSIGKYNNNYFAYLGFVKKSV